EQFFTQALGGPGEYPGRNMRDAHTGLGIEPRHFQSVAGHLGAAMGALGVAAPLIDEVISAGAPLQGEIPEARPPQRPAHAPPQVPHKSARSTAGQPASRSGNGANENGEGLLSDLGGLRAVLGGAQVNLFLADTEFNIVYVNDKGLET